ITAWMRHGNGRTFSGGRDPHAEAPSRFHASSPPRVCRYASRIGDGHYGAGSHTRFPVLCAACSGGPCTHDRSAVFHPRHYALLCLHIRVPRGHWRIPLDSSRQVHPAGFALLSDPWPVARAPRVNDCRFCLGFRSLGTCRRDLGTGFEHGCYGTDRLASAALGRSSGVEHDCHAQSARPHQSSFVRKVLVVVDAVALTWPHTDHREFFFFSRLCSYSVDGSDGSGFRFWKAAAPP